MYCRPVVRWATLLVAAVVAIQIVGCGDDDENVQSPAPTPTPPVLTGGDTTPEGLIVDMAKSALGSVVGHEVDSLLFPNPSIDYQTLMNDFLNALQLKLDQQTITEQEGDVNGEMMNLNESNIQFLATSPCDTTGINDVYNAVIVEESPVNETLGVLEQYPQQSLAGWMSGAQVKLGFLALEIQLNAIRDPGNSSVQTELASDFQTFITYAETTRNQVLYSNIATAISKITSCHDVSCGGSAPSCNGPYAEYKTYKDCNGTSHYWGDSNNAAECASARAANIDSCGPQVFNKQNQSVAWIEQVVSLWRSTLAGMSDQIADVSKPCTICQETQSFITVDQATISITGDQPAGTPQDATAWLQAACNGTQTCDYKLAHADYGESGPFTLVDVSYRCGSDPTEHTVNITGAGNPLLNEGAYIHLDCAQRIANMQVTFRGQPVQSSNTTGTETDLSTGSGHPNAGLIDNGVFAPEGHSAADLAYVIVLPHNGSYGALTIDLGATVNICGNGYDCKAEPEIQADNDDKYELDYSTDGVNWTNYGQFPTPSDSGLRTRNFNCNTRPNLGAPCSSTNHGPNFKARYVRVFAVSGGNTFSVSELQLYNTGSQVISVGKPAWGPEPLITNGQYAPAGTSYNDAQYATVLAGTGTANAQLIDLGQVHYVSHVIVQADHNDVYQVDVSTDGANWVSFYTVPTVSAGGLQTRDSGPLQATLGRYVRVYATSGDGKYSVSEVQLFTNATLPACNGLPDCTFSVAELIKDQTGAPPSAQDLQDFVATWTCNSAAPPPTSVAGATPTPTPTCKNAARTPTSVASATPTGSPTPYTSTAVPWNGDAVVSVTCLPSAVTCNPSQVTTCSVFAPIIVENGNSAAQQRPDDVVYENVGVFLHPICVSSQYPQCTQVIAGKTNYYHTSSSSTGTHNDPACLNVQRAIHDAIGEGSCPAGVAANANTSQNVWPYNLPLGGGQTSTCLPDPATQPALLPFIGCGPYVQ